jgi:cephalosporin-C deacetylase-like acetyl esterase
VLPTSPLRRPVDFTEFWSRTPRRPVARQPAATRAGIRLEWLSFVSLGDARLSGYLLGWADGAPRPLIVHGHRYGGRRLPARPTP